jgi:predicted metalloprotease with PDZ domain
MQAPVETSLGGQWPSPHRSFAVARTSARLVAAVLASIFVSCAGSQDVAEPLPTAAEPPGLALRVAMASTSRGLSAEVAWRWVDTGPMPPEVRFRFPSSWAGRDGLLDDVRSVDATTLDGLELDTDWDGADLIVRTEGAAGMVLDYSVVPGESALTELTRFMPLLDDRRFFAPGSALLAQPLNATATELRSITLDLDAHSAGWRPMTTLPDRDTYHIRDLIDAAYFAGAFESVVAMSGDLRVELWGEAELVSVLDRVANLTLSVVQSQAALLGPELVGLTRVVVLARDDDGPVTGTGREGGFVMELPATRNPPSDRIVAVLAHENLHRLIGHSLTFGGEDELATLWFREGVTDYLSIRLSVSAQLADETSLFSALSAALTNYRGNPAAELDAEEFAAGYWGDGDRRRLPYDKGALLALLIDLELRQSPDRSLLGFVEFLRDDPGARAAPLTNAVIGDALARYCAGDWPDFFARWVIGAEPLPLEAAFDDLGLDVTERMRPAPWFGFRATGGSDGTWLVSEVVADSPAARAGLRAGTALAAEPVYEGSVESPLVRLALVEGTQARLLTIRGEIGQRRAFALVEAAGSEQRYRSRLGLP